MPYPNKTINDGPYGSFIADPANADIGIYRRCIFIVPSVATPDGKPTIRLASATELADVVTMQPIAAGQSGAVKFVNCGGELYGVISGQGANAAAIYAAASGLVSTSSGGGAVIAGRLTCVGQNSVVTYAPIAS